MKKLLAFTIIPLFVGMSLQLNYITVEKSTPLSFDGNTLYVGGNGSGNYTSIQSAINDANDGDTVFVYDDSSPYYADEYIDIDKSINLIGENRETTKIYNDWGWYVIYISADWVNISEFTIISEYYAEDNYGIYLDSSNNNISSNILIDNWCGIFLTSSSSDNIISNNIFNGDFFSTGLYLSDSNNNNMIKNNTFSLRWTALYLWNSSNNIITNNYFKENQHCIILDNHCMNNTIARNKLIFVYCCTCIGIESYCNNNIIISNIIRMYSDWGAGIIIASKDNIVIGNLVSNCGHGIYLFDSTDNKILCNNIINCIKHGIILYEGPPLKKEDFNLHFLDSKCINKNNNKITNDYYAHQLMSYSDNNAIHHNNFINNGKNANDEFSNEWDNGYPSGGNYWDDYNGTDANGDGIGDIPYPIPGGDNKDRYPLIEPWEDNLIPIAKFTWAPSHPAPGEEILFNASESIDYDGYIKLYRWDWDNDGEYDETHYHPTVDHRFDEIGFYPVTLIIHDNESEIDTITKTIRVGNLPPDDPIITGPLYCKVGVSYHYNFSLSDSDNDSMYLRIDWGNGTLSPWQGPYDSNTTIKLNHTWDQKGTFTIRAQAKDIYGAESDWGTLTVTMPRNKILYASLFLKFLDRYPLIQNLLDNLGWYS